MAEKRTKADQLQRSIERAERRRGTRSEDVVAKAEQDEEPVTTIPVPTRAEEQVPDRENAA